MLACNVSVILLQLRRYIDGDIEIVALNYSLMVFLGYPCSSLSGPGYSGLRWLKTAFSEVPVFTTPCHQQDVRSMFVDALVRISVQHRTNVGGVGSM